MCRSLGVPADPPTSDFSWHSSGRRAQSDPEHGERRCKRECGRRGLRDALGVLLREETEAPRVCAPPMVSQPGSVQGTRFPNTENPH
jgi:hypothetical protein